MTDDDEARTAKITFTHTDGEIAAPVAAAAAPATATDALKPSDFYKNVPAALVDGVTERKTERRAKAFSNTVVERAPASTSDVDPEDELDLHLVRQYL